MNRHNLRILAAIAGPLALIATMHPAHASPAPTTAVTATPETRMDHISVVAIGKGAPVILIPGLSSPRAVWDGVAPALAKTHRVYLVQVNGFAGDAPGANLSPGILDGIVADLHTLIAKEKIAGAAVVGHSLGGLVSLMLAKAHPGDAGRIMAVDSLPFYGALFGPGVTVAQVAPRGGMMRDAMVASQGHPDPAMAKRTAAQLALKPESRALVERWFMATDQRVSGQAMYEDLTTDLRPGMAAIATPITLVYPYSDAVPKERADALYRGAYAGARHVAFVPVADAAHFVMLDQPAAFAAALDAFLAG